MAKTRQISLEDRPARLSVESNEPVAAHEIVPPVQPPKAGKHLTYTEECALVVKVKVGDMEIVKFAKMTIRDDLIVVDVDGQTCRLFAGDQLTLEFPFNIT